jgi:galactose oxidase-like protein/fibronectin type III domain protein/kelch motif-containing protein
LAAGTVALATAPAASAAATPAFVQQASAHGSSKSSMAVTTGASVATGDRLVVEVGVWNSKSATTSSVTDSLGDSFVEVTNFTASDGAQMSIWTAPVPAGGTADTVTAKPSSAADMAIIVLEYSGLSTVSDITAVDQFSHSTGKTTAAATVQSVPTAPAANSNELAVGFYADSGFGDTLTGGSGWAVRANVSPTSDVEMLAEDQPVSAAATPAASVGTGANTIWLMATVVFSSGTQSAPGAPTEVGGSPGNDSANLTWTAPESGGSAITSYTITPYIGTAAQPTTVITGTPPATSATVSGLTNGTQYSFTVSATNAIGTGPASAPTGLVTPSPEPQGEWGSLMTFPMEAISSILMDNGNFLFWDGWQQPEPTEVWNPANPTAFTTLNAPDSVFCDGAAQMPNGNIIVVGGYGGLTTGNLGIVDTNIFDPSTNTWTRVANMNLPRWYPDLVELSNGEYVAISGNSTDANHWADTPELYNPTTNTWTLLSNISTSEVHEEEYPFSDLIPNGNVLTIGPSEDVTYEMNVANQTWTPVGGQSGVVNGSSIQYRPGQILYSGGASSVIATEPSVNTTAVLNTNGANPAWQQTQPMQNARVYHDLVMLANGQVMAVGGSGTSDQSVVTTGVLPTEIWDPTSETWSAAAPIAAARNYHSTAVLMPTGQILSAGGGHWDGLDEAAEENAQIYSPSYLFNGPRPTITSAPSSAAYGSTISVTTPNASSITAVNLVSLGTDTHQMDMNQHFVPLSFTAGNGSLNVTMPSSAADAPPGNYMLFILNQSGTPSIANMIGLNQPTTPTAPSAPTGVTATAGNGTATVSWTAPSNGNSPITSYTVTPTTGGVAQTPTVVSGNPPATGTTISGLTNGDSYTFTVTATNAVGTGPASGPSNAVTPQAPTVPATPTGVAATAGNASATVSWTAPSNGGSPISSYTVTPYLGGTAQTTTTVTGSPPATIATVTGLTNGQSYTFTVAATNAVGTSPPSAPSNAVTPSLATPPAFVQQASTHVGSATSISVTPSQPLGSGNRLVVEVGAWSSSNATTTSVTDSAGDTFTEVSNFVGPDETQQSVWTAPITAGASNTPTITAKFSSAASGAIAALEYSGLSSAAGSAAVDQKVTASGTTSAAGTVSSGPTAATTAGNELAIGFYSDSGFGDTLTPGSGYTARANISNTDDIELLSEDQVVGAGATPGATVGTGAKTIWEMATVVFKAGSQAPPTAPSAPTGVTATAGNASAVVSWTAPASNGSPITSYTVTPYVGTTAQTPTVVKGTPPATSTSVTGLTNGTIYTFKVSATNGVGTGPASAQSNQVEPTAPTAPAAPTNVAATAGNQSATVSWSAPANGGSPITMYTVTPYLAGVAQSATVVSGSPPATTANVAGLTNGDAYTFTVSATNAIGTGPASAQSPPVTPTATVAPAFVQQVSAHGSGATSISVKMPANVTTGNRLVVEVADWSSSKATVSSVTDSAGDTFTEVASTTASDGTNQTVWTAPITASGGTEPTIMAKPSAKADLGIAALEYSGLSTAAGTAAVDQMAAATGTTTTARSVDSGLTPATTAPNELAIGFYSDSGFGDTLSGGAGYSTRVNVSPAGDIEFLVEDEIVGQAATPSASVSTGASTIWEMATVVFKS